MKLINAKILTDGKDVFNDFIKIKEEIEEFKGYISINDLLTILDSQPIAFDIDKVIRQVLDIKELSLSQRAEIIDIIKNGGV